MAGLDVFRRYQIWFEEYKATVEGEPSIGGWWGYHYSQYANEWWNQIEEQELLGLVELFFRPYWNRLWIVQEILLAKALVLMCGTMQEAFRIRGARSSEAAYCRLAWVLIAQQDVFGKTTCGYSDLMNQRVERMHPRLRRDQEFTYLLNIHSRRSCADPRDKVFGWQACLRPSERMKVDYALTAKEVFMNVAEQVIPGSDLDLDAALMGNLYDEMGFAKPAGTYGVDLIWKIQVDLYSGEETAVMRSVDDVLLQVAKMLTDCHGLPSIYRPAKEKRKKMKV